MINAIKKHKNAHMRSLNFEVPKLIKQVCRFIVSLVLVVGAFSAYADEDKRYFDIREMTVSAALKAFAIQTDSEILFTTSIVKDKKTKGLRGKYTDQEALQKLLSGTGLSVDKSDDKVYLIHAAKQPSNMDSSRRIDGADELFQENEEKKSSKIRQIEEVMVTANKREQNLQDVAYGLSAMSGESLNRIGAVSAEDYLGQIPGVNYNSLGRGRSPIIIRGVSTISTTILSDAQSTSAVYIDDLPSLQRWGAWTNTDPNMYDVDRVEVLRGPQGTLFGSGALGGAVRVINNKPDANQFLANFELGQSFTEGGDDSNSISGMLNIPLVEEKLALRVVGFVRDEGGYIDNIRRNEKNVNSSETKGGRLMLSYQATDNLHVRFTTTHQSDEVDDGSATFRDKADGDRYEYNGVLPEGSDVSIDIYNLTAEYDFGPATLTSSTTYAERESFINLDIVSITDAIFGTGLNPEENDYSLDETVETFAQEFRITSQLGGALEWTFGAFYFDQEIKTFQLWTADNLVPNTVLETLFFPHVTERALFGEVTYQLNETVRVTVGGRWFDNTFKMKIPTDRGPLASGPLQSTEENSSSFTPKLSISYKPTEDFHLYFTATEGFRVGQVNIGVAPGNDVPLTYDPDSLWNYELGIKSIWLDGRLKLNVAAFYIDWSDIQLQRTVVLPSGLILNFNDNAGDATSEGFEGELTYLYGDSWEFGMSFTYTDAELESAVSDTGLTEGSTLPGTPDYSLSNYIQYTAEELPKSMSGYLRISHRYVGEMVSNIVNADHLYSDTYNVFDLRAGLIFDRYEIALYVENLVDEDAATSKYDLDLFNVNTFRAYRLRPRTMGLTFRADF